MFDYRLPFKSELLELRPYRTNNKLEEKIRYVFRHAKFRHRQLFLDASTSGSRSLVRDMANIGVAGVRYFIEHPQQFNHRLENIHLQLLVQMWKQTFLHTTMQNKEVDEYYAVPMKILSVENQLLEELLRTCMQKDYYETGDNMVKVRDAVKLRERKNNKVHNPASLIEGGKHFEYLCSLE